MIKYVACITSYTDGTSDGPIRMSVVVTDVSKNESPILFSSEWWARDFVLDEMVEDLDNAMGYLHSQYTNLCVVHVRGLAPLKRDAHGYFSNIIMKKDLGKLIRDYPEQFEWLHV